MKIKDESFMNPDELAKVTMTMGTSLFLPTVITIVYLMVYYGKKLFRVG